MNNKGKDVAELTDGKCLWDLALVCDISHHLNKKIQGQRNSLLICLGSVWAIFIVMFSSVVMVLMLQ
jgi:hypothetical protein